MYSGRLGGGGGARGFETKRECEKTVMCVCVCCRYDNKSLMGERIFTCSSSTSLFDVRVTHLYSKCAHNMLRA